MNPQTRTATASIEGPHFDMRGFWKRQAQAWRDQAAEWRNTERIAMNADGLDVRLALFAKEKAAQCDQWAKEDEAKAI